MLTFTVRIGEQLKVKDYRRVGWDTFNQRGIWEGRFSPDGHWRIVVNTDAVRDLDAGLPPYSRGTNSPR